MTGWLDPPLTAAREVVARALTEDLGVFGDLTAGLVPSSAKVQATLASRAEGVLAGRLAATEAFAAVDPRIVVRWDRADGDRLERGTRIAHVAGPLASVLTAERTALNLLGHLSGVATMTRRFVDAAGGTEGAVDAAEAAGAEKSGAGASGRMARIRDTRKTTPGLRALEKAAVRAGGGVNHRASLSEGILIKDNHLGATTIGELVATANKRWPGQAVEVECDTLDQVSQAVTAGADMILLDNMTPAEAATVVKAVAGRALLEVSGRVDLQSVRAYAEAGVDFISVGALTHSAPVLDIGLDLSTQAAQPFDRTAEEEA